MSNPRLCCKRSRNPQNCRFKRQWASVVFCGIGAVKASRFRFVNGLLIIGFLCEGRLSAIKQATYNAREFTLR